MSHRAQTEELVNIYIYIHKCTHSRKNMHMYINTCPYVNTCIFKDRISFVFNDHPLERLPSIYQGTDSGIFETALKTYQKPYVGHFFFYFMFSNKHHHLQGVLTARIPVTFFYHSSLSVITLGKSSRQHPSVRTEIINSSFLLVGKLWYVHMKESIV